MKKTLALLLALVLAFSLTSVAMAAPEETTSLGQADIFSNGITTEVFMKFQHLL